MFKSRQPLWLRIVYLWLHGMSLERLHKYVEVEARVDKLLKMLTQKLDREFDERHKQVRADRQIRACLYVLDKVYKKP